MDFSSIFARFVALIGAVALQWRRLQGSAPAPAWGSAPAIPEAKPQGAIPTLKMPTAQGWSDGQKPTAAPGLKVNAFAKDLDHPRWINVLPNGDVLVAIDADRGAAQERVPLCDAGDDAARGGARRQRRPHHLVARP